MAKISKKARYERKRKDKRDRIRKAKIRSKLKQEPKDTQLKHGVAHSVVALSDKSASLPAFDKSAWGALDG